MMPCIQQKRKNLRGYLDWFQAGEDLKSQEVKLTNYKRWQKFSPVKVILPHIRNNCLTMI